MIESHTEYFEETFQALKLGGIKIANTEFEGCVFRSCDFDATFFSTCKFIECRFEACNLSVAKLTGSKLGDVEFVSSKLIGIDWTMCDWDSLLGSEGVRFYASHLNDGNFHALTLDRLIMKECFAKDADFRNASLKNADLRGTDFLGALFQDTHLDYADFTEAKNIALKLCTNHLQGTRMSHYEALSLLEATGIVVT